MEQATGEKSCPKKQGLLDEYQRATDQYATRLQELESRMATAPKPEYDNLRQVVERARLQSERARLDLETHIRNHRC